MLNTRTRVLLIEDNKVDQMAFKRLVKDENLSYDCTIADSVSETKKILDAKKFDIIVADYLLGDGTAFDIFDLVKDVPIIITTEVYNKEIISKAMKVGSSDYLIKDSERYYFKLLPVTIEKAIDYKNIEKTFRESDKRLSSILKTIPDIVYRLNVNGIITFIGDAVRKYGYFPEELIGTDFLELIHPEDRKKAWFRINERRTGDRSTKCLEVRLLKKDHTAVPFQIKSRVIENEPIFLISAEGFYTSDRPKTENFMGTQGIASDITAQKMIEEKLKRVEQEKATILNSITELVEYKDKEMKIIWANKAACESAGLPLKELVGRHCYEIWQHRTKHCVECPVLKTLENGKVQEGEITYPDGTVWFVRGYPVLDISDNVVGMVQIKLNTTEHKCLKEQLLQSEKLSLVGQFMSGIAHELNNPLGIISGYCELMKSFPNIGDEEQKILDKVVQAAEKCSTIVKNLLKFSRKHETEKANININNILYDVVSISKNQFKVNNIIIEKNFSELLLMTVGDSNQLNSVFLNLINNAYDVMYSANKKGKLIIKTYQENNNIVIEFIDDGPGIPEEIQCKIFKPFFTTKKVGKGTGLGLSLCAGIIQEHRGQLYLDKTYNQGAKFVVKIPILESIKEKVIKEKAMELPYKANILVIDDEPEILSLQKNLLESKGCYVDIVDTGKKGFDLVKKNNYDIIICDMKMPGNMDGEGIYEQIKLKDEELAKRIIFATGDISDETKEFFEKNNILYIIKPFKINDFLAIVGQEMKRKVFVKKCEENCS